MSPMSFGVPNGFCWGGNDTDVFLRVLLRVIVVRVRVMAASFMVLVSEHHEHGLEWQPTSNRLRRLYQILNL